MMPIARLLTPFARGFLGWTTRVPLWHYAGNRPRVGKDYCATIPIVLMEGYAFEDQPIGKSPGKLQTDYVGRASRKTFHALFQLSAVSSR